MRAIDAKSFIIGVLSAVVVVMAMGAHISGSYFKTLSKEEQRKYWLSKGWGNNGPVHKLEDIPNASHLSIRAAHNGSKFFEVKMMSLGDWRWNYSETRSQYFKRGDGLNGCWTPFAVGKKDDGTPMIYVWRVPDDNP